ncbi:MAG: alanyl-tRNA editing protein [Acidobacteria bacterium]|nr:alanyl-tRNA editing protein [Acidobacteriota bacterium]
MTRRLYYEDSYLSSFQARVVELQGARVYLDQTAFYPASGGQPSDSGTIAGISVTDVIDEGERVAHLLDAAPDVGIVEGRIDWARRFDHMQQHTGQHLLSAVLLELFGFATLSFHMGAGHSTIDLDTPAITPEQLRRAEERVNERVAGNWPVSVSFADAAGAEGLRKPASREGALRIVTIAGIDRSACGGTHVRAAGEIGLVLIRKADKVRGGVRLEFLCGKRAVLQARRDLDALSRIARIFSCAAEAAPDLVAAQAARLQEADKHLHKLAAEVARARGMEAWRQCTPDHSGLRIAVCAVETLDNDLRAEAGAFVSNPAAVFLASSRNPPAILLASSNDSGLDAGALVKQVLEHTGGRGGGGARIAQASIPAEKLVRASELARELISRTRAP